MHRSLPPLQPEVSPLGQTLWEFRGFFVGGGFFFLDEKEAKRGKKKVCNLLNNLFPSSRETTRLSRGKGGECCPGKKSQQTVRAQNAPTPTHAAPRALAVPGGGEVCESAGSVSGACPGPGTPRVFCSESGPR